MLPQPENAGPDRIVGSASPQISQAGEPNCIPQLGLYAAQVLHYSKNVNGGESGFFAGQP
jgi:hypothetical protein